MACRGGKAKGLAHDTTHPHPTTAAAFNIDSCGTGGGNPTWYQKGGWSYHEGCVGF